MWLDKLHGWRSSTTTCERVGVEGLLGMELGQDVKEMSISHAYGRVIEVRS